jgi:hypothetical protein
LCIETDFTSKAHRVEIYGEQGQREDQELITRFAALDGMCQDVVTATVMHRASMIDPLIKNSFSVL